MPMLKGKLAWANSVCKIDYRWPGWCLAAARLSTEQPPRGSVADWVMLARQAPPHATKLQPKISAANFQKTLDVGRKVCYSMG